MAIWQWDVWLVPREEVVRRFEVIPEHLDLDIFESIEWWKELSPDLFICHFDTLLPIYHAPWARDMKSWGSDKGNRVELMVEQGRITDLVIRVDLRELDFELLNGLIDLANEQDLIFFPIESQKFIEPRLETFLTEIGNSRKIVFISDPARFFADKTYFEDLEKENQRRSLSILQDQTVKKQKR